MKRTGMAREEASAASTPPLAVPSSLVTMSPVTPSASSKAATWATAFWPILASSTTMISCGASGSDFCSTRFTFLISSIRCNWVGRRPAVSANTMSMPRALAASTASKHTAAESPFSCEMTVTPLRAPHSCNCSRAAARKVSPAARMTDLPCDWKYLASLPMLVVLPAPLMPASMMTKGVPLSGRTSGCSSGRMCSCNASLSDWRSSAPSLRPLSETRRRTSSINCSVASIPMSLVSSTVSSSSYRSSSILPPPNTPASDLAMWSRDLVRPCLRRAAQPALAGWLVAGVSCGGAESGVLLSGCLSVSAAVMSAVSLSVSVFRLPETSVSCAGVSAVSVCWLSGAAGWAGGGLSAAVASFSHVPAHVQTGAVSAAVSVFRLPASVAGGVSGWGVGLVMPAAQVTRVSAIVEPAAQLGGAVVSVGFSGDSVWSDTGVFSGCGALSMAVSVFRLPVSEGVSGVGADSSAVCAVWFSGGGAVSAAGVSCGGVSGCAASGLVSVFDLNSRLKKPSMAVSRVVFGKGAIVTDFRLPERRFSGGGTGYLFIFDGNCGDG